MKIHSFIAFGILTATQSVYSLDIPKHAEQHITNQADRAWQPEHRITGTFDRDGNLEIQQPPLDQAIERIEPLVDIGLIFANRPRRAIMLGSARWTQLADEVNQPSEGLFQSTRIVFWGLERDQPEHAIELAFSRARKADQPSATPGTRHHFAAGLLPAMLPYQPQPFLVALYPDGTYEAFRLKTSSAITEKLIQDIQDAVSLYESENKDELARKLVASDTEPGDYTRALILHYASSGIVRVDTPGLLAYLLRTASETESLESRTALELLSADPDTAFLRAHMKELSAVLNEHVAGWIARPKESLNQAPSPHDLRVVVALARTLDHAERSHIQSLLNSLMREVCLPLIESRRTLIHESLLSPEDKKQAIEELESYTELMGLIDQEILSMPTNFKVAGDTRRTIATEDELIEQIDPMQQISSMFPPAESTALILGEAMWIEREIEAGKQSRGVFHGREIIAWPPDRPRPELPVLIDFETAINSDSSSHSGHQPWEFPDGFHKTTPARQKVPFAVVIDIGRPYTALRLKHAGVVTEEIVADFRRAALIHRHDDPDLAIRELLSEMEKGEDPGLYTRALIINYVRLEIVRTDDPLMIEFLMKMAAQDNQRMGSTALKALAHDSVEPLITERPGQLAHVLSSRIRFMLKVEDPPRWIDLPSPEALRQLLEMGRLLPHQERATFHQELSAYSHKVLRPLIDERKQDFYRHYKGEELDIALKQTQPYEMLAEEIAAAADDRGS